MTLNQRKSELYALAALVIGAVGLGPEVWAWGLGWREREVARDERLEDRDRGWEKEGDGRVDRQEVEGKESKERTRDIVRGLLVFGGGLGAGGWAVWG